MPQIKRAIVSVTDKTGLADFCRCLTELKVEIISTGGTARLLKTAGIPVKEVSAFTGFPEALDGRLKTLHPKIEGGILGIRGNPLHLKEMQSLGIEPIDLVVVNLYPFEKTIEKENLPLGEAIENIDIGGPTMLRAAAKNHRDVTVVIDPADYRLVAEELKNSNGVVSPETNFRLAVKVFQATARYDGVIGNYLHKRISSSSELFPQSIVVAMEKISGLRYGENPHQRASYYREIPAQRTSLAFARQIHGKELSFNNLMDLESAWEAVCEFDSPAAVIIKHTNPCGAAVAWSLKEAFVKARDCDPVSSFGGIIGFNRNVDGPTAKAIGETFFECIIAPAFDESAIQILTAKKNIRLMVLDGGSSKKSGGYDFKKVGGGFLVQEKDSSCLDLEKCNVVTKKKPTENQYEEMDFAWKMVKHVKSNAIVFAKNRQMIGVGAGQTSRVDSVKLAVIKASYPLDGSVLASDAFFPFRDALDLAIKQKITAVVQPGGSVRDSEIISAADECGLAMIFTGIRHFRH